MSNKKPIVLTFMRYYLPGFKSGGPVRSISNMVKALGDEFDFHIVTTDRDLLDIAPYQNITINGWNEIGKARVYYTPPGKIGLTLWKRIIEETPYDILYLNSLLDPSFTLLPLTLHKFRKNKGRSVVLAPRGEFSPGALALKRWKKTPFLFVAQLIGLYNDVTWHASAEKEAELIGNFFSKKGKILVAHQIGEILIAPDLPNSPARVHANTDCSGENSPIKIVFLSRISRMKNLNYALEVIKNCNVPVEFDIWGGLEDMGYWHECQKLMVEMPSHITVHYQGVAAHENVETILAGYDLFFLPTRGENYGHVIAEALSAGTPVLISDQTPWRGLSELGVGWDLPLENDGAAFLEAIETASKRSRAERDNLRGKIADYARLILTAPSLLEANRFLFQSTLA